MTEFNFEQAVVEVDGFQAERALHVQGVRADVHRLRRRREAGAIQAQPPIVAPAALAAKAGGGGQGSTSHAAGQVPPEESIPERVLRRWNSEPALHTEFGCLSRFAAYEKASAQGRAHIGRTQQNRVQKPERVDRRWTGE